jgi:hypothetical protein
LDNEAAIDGKAKRRINSNNFMAVSCVNLIAISLKLPSCLFVLSLVLIICLDSKMAPNELSLSRQTYDVSQDFSNGFRPLEKFDQTPVKPERAVRGISRYRCKKA